MSTTSISSINTNTPETKQPPNKRHKKSSSGSFVVLSTQSGKRHYSEKKVTGNEKRIELFTSDSSDDESNNNEEPHLNVLKGSVIVHDDNKENVEHKSFEKIVSFVENLMLNYHFNIYICFSNQS